MYTRLPSKLGSFWSDFLLWVAKRSSAIFAATSIAASNVCLE
jgi:hypothetical protein